MLKKISFFILLTISVLSLNAQIIDNNYKQNQPKENSLLSRYGLGNLNPQYFASNAGMGGMTAAYRDRYHLNPFNPASLPALRTTAYEVGLYAKSTDVKSSGGNSSAWSGNLNNLALGFPTYSVINEVLDRKPRAVRWGMAMSLMPYSTVGYNINTVTPAQNSLDSSTLTNYFVGSGGVILKTTNGGGSPIGIEPISSNIPESYMLFQNYPNPFNPVTKIKFSIPANANGIRELTSLKIYDILGSEIANPVNEILSAGEYEIEWFAENFPSGVYFYSLTNGNFSETGKMILLK